MYRRHFLTVSTLSALSCSRKQPGALGALTEKLEAQIPGLLKTHQTPGLSILIIQNAQIAYRRGFGVTDAGTQKPVDNETVFEAASTSKPVFAYAVMKLCERGVLSLDTPLTKYTKNRFLKDDPRLDLITARHVLSHTTGFQNWRNNDDPLQIHFTPGEKHSYSGEGYAYLQSVVSQITGQPIEDYMRANIFKPFGMTKSGYVWNGIFEAHAARPHDPNGQPLNNRKRTKEDAARYAAAGDLHTTPTDYARFLLAVINPAPADEYRLTKKSLDEMVKPQVQLNDAYKSAWALGWKTVPIGTRHIITHGGDNLGFHCVAAAALETKSGFYAMTNGENGTAVLGALAPTLDAFLAG
ncbi:MAG: serine hydrolase [Acidobacteria bacterium]|nr:serine hydrolase [Acidobacteriota bacterium]